MNKEVVLNNIDFKKIDENLLQTELKSFLNLL